jgi:signal transduction histidine kinase
MVAEDYRGFLQALRGSVRVRTTAAAVAVVAIALLVGAVALVASLHAVLVREVRATASLRATEAARVVAAGGDPTAAASRDDDIVVQVLDPSGRVVSATRNAIGRAALARLGPGQSREIDVPFDDDPFLIISAPAGDRTVLLGQSLDTVTGLMSALTVLLAIGLPALLFLVGATTWRVVGRALAPVEKIRAEVDAISTAQLHRRVPRPAGNDEIAELAGTMNRMLDRLEQVRANERRFVADASHELRSPVAAIRQHAEVALAHPELSGPLARTVHTESLRMQVLIDDLLLLAQADENSLPLRRQPVDLDDLVFAEARRLRELTVAVDTTGVAAARVNGDPAALRRVLRNIGDNAARHARGRIGLKLMARDGWAELCVDDDGPGVPGPGAGPGLRAVRPAQRRPHAYRWRQRSRPRHRRAARRRARWDGEHR